jgi:hypothetical protein
MSLEGDFEPKGDRGDLWIRFVFGFLPGAGLGVFVLDPLALLDRPVLLLLVPLASGAACGLAAVVWGRGFWRWLSATMDKFWWWRASRR